MMETASMNLDIMRVQELRLIGIEADVLFMVKNFVRHAFPHFRLNGARRY